MTWYYHTAFQWSCITLSFILVYFICLRRVLRVFHEVNARKIAIETDKLIRDTKYDEKEVIGHLDYLIIEILDQYEVIHIQPKNIYYINGKLEQEIIDHVIEELNKRLSKTLRTQLSFIYSEQYLGAYIATHVYFITLDYVLTHNLENAEENTNAQNQKVPVVTNTDIGEDLLNQ